LLFPLTYTFGDVFTEVYGYPASRRAIWIGFFASALLSAAVAMVADHGWHNQQAFETVFGLVPRFVAAGLIAYWVGDEANAFVLARLKVLTHRRWLWTCAIGSTIVGQRCDSFLVSFLAGSEDRPKLV
jgi:queuosine precursor transporter